jgi:hypothetical protein
MKNMKKHLIIFIVIIILGFGLFGKIILAETSPSVLYVPLIGITSVPDPSTLPKEGGSVTYNYAVKNFLEKLPLADIQVIDDKCGPVKFVNGDDNGDSKLDYSETWRYDCTAKLSATTQSIATATGTINNITATHKAYATVIVGSNKPAPLVSIVNITKVAYPLPLSAGGADITFTYKVSNPGTVPLENVTVTDDKCSPMSGKLGDTNANNLLDAGEVWIYTCATKLKQTTTSTATVTAFANGLEATDNSTITVNVETPTLVDKFTGGLSAGVNFAINSNVWAFLLGVLVTLIVCFFLTRRKKVR